MQVGREKFGRGRKGRNKPVSSKAVQVQMPQSVWQNRTGESEKMHEVLRQAIGRGRWRVDGLLEFGWRRRFSLLRLEKVPC